MTVRIKDLPVNERPRERLIRYGVSLLSNEELLSILFKSGFKNESVKAMSNSLLSSINNINELKDKTYNQLIKIKGIGPSKACTLLSAIELGRRINIDSNIEVYQKILGSVDVFNYYRDILCDKKQECFYVMYLDNQKKFIKDKLLFIGIINKSLVHPQNIFKEAYLVDASAIICVHNHPSGNVMPSKDDFNVTKQLVEIGNLFGIKVVDHIIIGRNGYYSFFENGEIK